jgi:hypothetical protein
MTGRKEGRQLEKLVGRPCHLLQLFYLPWQLSCRSQARLTVAETGKERIHLEAVRHQRLPTGEMQALGKGSYGQSQQSVGGKGKEKGN